MSTTVNMLQAKSSISRLVESIELGQDRETVTKSACVNRITKYSGMD